MSKIVLDEFTISVECKEGNFVLSTVVFSDDYLPKCLLNIVRQMDEVDFRKSCLRIDFSNGSVSLFRRGMGLLSFLTLARTWKFILKNSAKKELVFKE